MKETGSSSGLIRLILVPSLIALAVTLLRLTGELLHWSPRWFSPATGGIQPSGVSWVLGITWLAFPFGAYFAMKLLSGGLAPASTWKPVIYALAGTALLLVAYFFLFPRLTIGFPQILLLIWLAMAVPAALQLMGWPDLFKTLLAYALASRIPVALLMLFAMRGNWGTHYDYVDTPEVQQLALVPRYFWLAFFPQLVFWVSFTILAGSLAGSLVVALSRRGAASALQPAA